MAQKAKTSTDESGAREEVKLAYIEAQMEKYEKDDDTIANIMTVILQKQDEDALVVGEEELEAYYKGYIFTLENGNITSSKK